VEGSVKELAKKKLFDINWSKMPLSKFTICLEAFFMDEI